jgi:hypothetical protein
MRSLAARWCRAIERSFTNRPAEKSARAAVAATATYGEVGWDTSEGRPGSMVTNVVCFPRRPLSNVIQFNRHGAFSVADVQAIRNHFSAHAEPGRATTLRWSVRGSGECVQIDDSQGEPMVTFGIRAGSFYASGPFASGRALTAESSLRTLLDQLPPRERPTVLFALQPAPDGEAGRHLPAHRPPKPAGGGDGTLSSSP